MYDGRNTYSFTAALKDATATQKQRDKEREGVADKNFWQAHASGHLYRSVSYGFGRPSPIKPVGKVVHSAPTAEQMHRHIAKYGPEGTATIIAAHGLNMKAPRAVAPKPKRHRRSSVELVAQVLELHERGLMPDAIADTLNVATRRVKTLLAA